VNRLSFVVGTCPKIGRSASQLGCGIRDSSLLHGESSEGGQTSSLWSTSPSGTCPRMLCSAHR